MALLKASNLSNPPEVAEEDDDVTDEFGFGLVRLPNVFDAIVPEFLMELPKEVPPSPLIPNPNADFPFPAVEEKGEHPVVPRPNELPVPKAEVAVVDDAAVMEPLSFLEVVSSSFIPIQGISFPVSTSMIPHDEIVIDLIGRCVFVSVSTLDISSNVFMLSSSSIITSPNITCFPFK